MVAGPRTASTMEVVVQYRFAEFEIDLSQHELRRLGESVHIEPQVFDLIVHLVRNHNRIVSKDELIETIWNGRIISEAALSSRINGARRALADNGNDQALTPIIPESNRSGARPKRLPKRSISCRITFPSPAQTNSTVRLDRWERRMQMRCWYFRTSSRWCTGPELPSSPSRSGCLRCSAGANIATQVDC